jgi:quercetin 2,3-dioxygenase
MLTLRKARERGRTKIDWLESWHSFSFNDYRDPAHMGFGSLRVINEDFVAPGAGFPAHSHRDMEIVTYIVDGALAHKDSLGSGGVIRPGEIQRMSAGTGITHSEFNASPEAPVHFLQIWIVPSDPGIEPSYEQKKIDPASVANKFARIAAPEPRANEVRLMQNAEIWAAKFDREEEAMHALQQGRRAWIQVASGTVDVNGTRLEAGDGVAVDDEERLLVRVQGAADVLLFDLV